MTDQLKRAISAAKIAQTNAEQAEATSIASSSAGDQNFDMSESSYKTSHTAVRKARRFAMQGLYEWLVTDHRFDTNGKLGWKANAPHDIAARTRASNAMHTVHIGYYHEMMHDIPEQIEALNVLISQQLDREIDKLDTVEHAILLIGAYELQNRLEIPYKVVLDEAMKLNNHFGATDAHKLINAVLDKMAIELRDLEVQADTKAHLRTSQKVAAKQSEAKQSEAKQSDAKQTESHEDAAETGIDSEPTASSKPRISANNTSVKRNRPNKANAGISAVKANIKNDVPDTVKTDSVKAAPTDTNPDTDNGETLPDSENSIAKTADSDASISESTDLTSVDSDSTEVDNAEVDGTAVDNSEPNSTDAKNND